MRRGVALNNTELHTNAFICYRCYMSSSLCESFFSSIFIEVLVIVLSKSTYILIVKAIRVHIYSYLSQSANCFFRLAKSHRFS
jgi:hypothetical protein